MACPSIAGATVAELPRLLGSIEIDGVIGGDEWRNAVSVSLDVETNPGENAPAPVDTLVYLIEDGENLYVAFVAADPDPDAIRAFLRDRDAAWEDDHVGIVLDTYNDERRAFQFYANPLGVQMDKTHDDTARGNRRNFDASWDAIWDSAGTIHEDGYTVEMRIPLSQLRFPGVDGEKTWGIDLLRVYPRDKTYHLSNNPQDRNRDCYLCQVGKLRGLEGSEPSRDLEIVPTVTGTMQDTTEDPAIEPIASGDLEVEGGLTIRWGVTPDLTANLTVNPDFSQIEADVAQLDVNNRFALFFPEKRPFFLEGADYFETPIDAVFTRTVADPDVGAKLTGKRGDHTFGMFAARDAVTNLLFPSPQESDTTELEQANDAFVARYSRGFDNTSAVGALVTLRRGDDYHNYLGGLDGRWKINDQHTLQLQVLGSETEYPLATALEFDQPQDTFSGHGGRFSYDYGSRNWFGRLHYSDFSSGFRADSGFVTQVGGNLLDTAIGRIWYGDEDSWWSRIRASLHHDVTHAEDGGLLERRSVARAGMGGAMQSWIQVALVDAEEYWEGAYYDLFKLRFFFEFTPFGGLTLRSLFAFGDQIDYTNGRLGSQARVEPAVNWNISRNLFLSLRGVSAGLETKSGEKIFDALVMDTRLTWQFNLRSYLRLTVQSTDVERNLDVYIEPEDARERSIGRELLYSYKLNPQTVFFLGYSDNHVDDDALDGLTATDRTWFMKIGYAWTP
jgi:hypothetical protein